MLLTEGENKIAYFWCFAIYFTILFLLPRSPLDVARFIHDYEEQCARPSAEELRVVVAAFSSGVLRFSFQFPNYGFSQETKEPTKEEMSRGWEGSINCSTLTTRPSVSLSYRIIYFLNALYCSFGFFFGKFFSEWMDTSPAFTSARIYYDFANNSSSLHSVEFILFTPEECSR